ncbi:hydroxyisourate hydrolase [Acinetobacter sp.]|uniref:hydroxyisourate hydrolase n=1 Tax=unclassified Acinetobacter TaxID=196816 RepID=UPI0039181BB5
MMKISILSISIASCSTVIFAQNPLSVHVLNLDTGLPASNVAVVLEAQQGDKWTKLNEAKTNSEGRITDLYPKDTNLQKGIYKVTFKTGDWFKAKNQRSFFPEVPVVFVIDGSLEHYHIPLLLSPYGYSTYRGN